jgi:Mn2+/Fe2+ NRAMP family transporter
MIITEHMITTNISLQKNLIILHLMKSEPVTYVARSFSLCALSRLTNLVSVSLCLGLYVSLCYMIIFTD